MSVKTTLETDVAASQPSLFDLELFPSPASSATELQKRRARSEAKRGEPMGERAEGIRRTKHASSSRRIKRTKDCDPAPPNRAGWFRALYFGVPPGTMIDGLTGPHSTWMWGKRERRQDINQQQESHPENAGLLATVENALSKDIYLTKWERDFCASLYNQISTGRTLTEKQKACLQQITNGSTANAA